jgi:hypothetical protein
MSETATHDHELEVLEDDQTVPPRPEEQVADARDGDPGPPGATSEDPGDDAST